MTYRNIVWEPSQYPAEESSISAFMNEYGYESYSDLRPETEDEIAEYWDQIARDIGIVWERPYTEVLDTSDGVEYPEWFVNGRLNLVETVLDRWVDRTPDAAVYHWEDERGNRDTVTYEALADRVSRVANALRAADVGRGDRVGVVYPFQPTAFVIAIACCRIGAVFVPVFPGYGTTALSQRLADSEATTVFTTDGYYRDGSRLGLAEKVDRAIRETPVETVIVEEHAGEPYEITAADSITFEAFVDGHDSEADPRIVDANEPAMIAYSSGTTGTPKGTIHTHSSLLVMGTKEVKHHFDLSRGDTQLWTTDFGWIIVPVWMISGAPAVGASTVLLEGSPMATEDRVWRAIDRYDVTLLGTSPTGAKGFRSTTPDPRSAHDLDSLRALASTGEPWDDEAWQWFFESVGDGELPIINASGGTEFGGALLAPTPMTPLKPTTLYGPAPGIPANVYDENGETADEGYLVCEGPVPGMTHSLTDGDDRYEEEYWSDFDGVWNQNDWVTIDDDGFWFVTGRADDTMNVAGRRITAPELEAAIEAVAAVDEAVIVPVPDDRKGQVPVAFVTTSGDARNLEEVISEHVAENLGAPFRPDSIHAVSTIPRTQTGKIPRSVISSTYLGEQPDDLSTLEDGTALHEYPQVEER